MFAFRQPGATTACWTAKLHVSQENALKLLASSGQKSLFIRPAQPDTEDWKKMWTMVWSNLPDVGETTLLPVLLSHAEKRAGHIGIAKAPCCASVLKWHGCTPGEVQQVQGFLLHLGGEPYPMLSL